METKHVRIAVCSQKGGVGKSTFTILLANLFHYRHGIDVRVIDADFPQWSIQQLRDRELKLLENSEHLKLKLLSQYEATGKKMWSLIKCSPGEVYRYNRIDTKEPQPSMTLVDLPGSVNGQGVLSSIAALDYVFIPLKADKIVMESSLSFAYMLRENIVRNPDHTLRGLLLFWTMIDKREKTHLYNQYENAIRDLGLPLMQTCIPFRVKFNKEITGNPGPVYRSTIFMPDAKFTADSALDELAREILQTIK